MHENMLQQIELSEKATATFIQVIKKLKVNTLLRQCGIRKTSGFSTNELFTFLLLLVFQGRNMDRYLNSKRGLDHPRKDTFYRFLNNPKYAWRRFLNRLSYKVVTEFEVLTSLDRVRVFILDDSVLSRSKSKKVELLTRIFDHANGRFIKGFTMLTLGWSDGFSFLPVDFAMLSSTKVTNRLNGINPSIDKRTSGYKRRKEALVARPEAASILLDNALSSGMTADYVLMDSWFTSEPMIKDILAKNLDVIGMLKGLTQHYLFQGEFYQLKELRKKLTGSRKKDILGSLCVETKHGIPVKLVFVQNQNKRSEWLVLLSTDIHLEAEEIVRIYGMRWSIEVFFKSTKSFLKLGSEFQGRNFDTLISHTTIVFTRYILLEWERRQNQDEKTFGKLFFMFCDEIKDVDFKTALQELMVFLINLKNTSSNAKKSNILSQVAHWINSQPSYIKVLLGDFACES